MKTSIRMLILLLALGFCAATLAQDEEDQSGQEDADSAEQIIEAVEALEGDPEAGVPVVETPPEDEAADTAEGQADEASESTEDAPQAEETAEAAGQDEPEAQADAAVQDETADPVEPEATEPEPEAVEPEAAQAEPEPMAPDELPAGQAEMFMLQGHPIFTPEQAERVYRPLVNYLNTRLPYRFDLRIAPDFHRYWLGIRRGETPHLVLEEPHLTALRINRDSYVPLVRAQEPITYSLLTSMNNAGASLDDFIGQRISTMPAPSLGYLILASWYENPMQQPIIQSNASSWLDAVEIVFSMEAQAAIVPHNLVERYVNMENVRTSQEFPGVTVSASPDVPADIRDEIRAALLELHEDEEHFVALHELDITRFIEADAIEYEGLEEWLSLVYSTY